MNDTRQRINDVVLGRDVRIMDFVNLYGCSIGDETLVGPFVEIQADATIGRRCKIESHTFVCSGTVIEDEVFVGHHVTFTNDRHPRATTSDGHVKVDEDWALEPSIVERRASIGSGSVILPGVRIGAGALVGAGSVVVRDVPPAAVVAGNPARPIPQRTPEEESTSRTVPLFDAAAEYRGLRTQIDDAIAGVLLSGRHILGPEVQAFESELSEVFDGRPVVSVGSGTDALRLALIALGVQAEDEVVIPANTFTATAMAVEQIGAIPVVADVDESVHAMTPETVEPLLTEATKAIIPVHLYGHPAPIRALVELATSRGIPVLEDAAQALGATAFGAAVGTWGAAAALSFYPSKNLGAFGDGGAIVCADESIAEQLRILRDLGRDEEGHHVELATNSRLDAIQAAILRVKLPYVRSWMDRRRTFADLYRAELDGVSLTLPGEAHWARHSYHLFVVRVEDRDRVRAQLQKAGVEAGIHYPTPIHLQPAHAGRVKAPLGAPVSERLAKEILTLPVHQHLQDDDVRFVARALRDALGGGGPRPTG